jgi:hypothetical protein
MQLKKEFIQQIHTIISSSQEKAIRFINDDVFSITNTVRSQFNWTYYRTFPIVNALRSQSGPTCYCTFPIRPHCGRNSAKRIKTRISINKPYSLN